MSDVIIKKQHEEIQVEWKIPDFLKGPEHKYSKSDYYTSSKFSFLSNLWHLVLFPVSSSFPYHMRFYINRDTARDDILEYQIGLKKVDGSGHHFVRGVLKGDERESDTHFINFSELNQRKHELVPSGTLNIICSLKRDTGHSIAWSKPKLRKITNLEELSESFKNLFADKESCDTILKIKGKEYNVHRTVLMARSSVFAAMFKHETSEKQTGVINIPDCEPDTFQQFLEYIYCGQLEEMSFHTAYHLYETSDKYDVQELKFPCMEYLMENVTVENFCDIVIMANKYEEDELFSVAQDFFNNNVSKILETSEWEHLLKDDYRLGNRLMKEMCKVKLAS